MKVVIIKTPKEFREFCSTLKPIWAFDCETTSLNWLDLEIIGFSICGESYDSDGTQVCYVDIVPQYKQELLQILDYYIHEAKIIIMHNSPFDLMVLKKEGIEI